MKQSASQPARTQTATPWFMPSDSLTETSQLPLPGLWVATGLMADTLAVLAGADLLQFGYSRLQEQS